MSSKGYGLGYLGGGILLALNLVLLLNAEKIVVPLATQHAVQPGVLLSVRRIGDAVVIQVFPVVQTAVVVEITVRELQRASRSIDEHSKFRRGTGAEQSRHIAHVETGTGSRSQPQFRSE